MKLVCQALGVARSHLHALKRRPASWVDGRTLRAPPGDAQLLAEIKQQIAELPSYGYRRACALVNRQRSLAGQPRVNPKRTYRVMAAHALLLPRAARRCQSSRPHDGRVIVRSSDTRWCSDGFEIKCDSGQTVTATFAKDCCDREIMAWRAWQGKGLPAEPVREMLLEAVGRRFGSVEAVPADHVLEFLTDNGAAYIAAETRRIARSLGLRPVNTPVCSPQSNGMAESFVNTFRRDYLSRMDLRDAPSVLAQLPAASRALQRGAPALGLEMRSPREFRRLHKQRPHHQDQPLHCA